MKGIVCLCGSTRFPELFALANAELTMQGYVVLSVGVFDRARFHNEADPAAVELKRRLDALHFDKIDMAWAIVALNGDGTPLGLGKGYTGASTRREIAHARDCGKPVFWFDIKAAMVALVSRDGNESVKREEWDWDGGDRSWLDLLPGDHPLRGAAEKERDEDMREYREKAAEAEAEGKGAQDQEALPV